MKKIKKIVSLCLAMVMCLGLSVTAASAAGTGEGKITVGNVQAGNTYKLYKVFDAAGDGADHISYTLTGGKTDVPNGFKLENGNVVRDNVDPDAELTPDEIASIASYVENMTAIDTKQANDGDTTVEFTGLDDGYYYITTTTGTLVTIDSVGGRRNVKVDDKNEAPKIDKTTTNGEKQDIAEVGASVPFTATIDVKKGAENYEFNDKMANMKFAEGAEGAITVAVGDKILTADDNAYEITIGENRDTLTIKFNNEWIKNQVNKKITIKYSAIITSDALTNTNPATNEASLTYGNNAGNKSTTEVVKVYNATITVKKWDGDNTNEKGLAGAGFKLKRNSDNKFYCKNEDGTITWVDEANAPELKTAEDNSYTIEFKGLDDGVYTLIETATPAGYNTADNETITIVDGNYESSNLHQTKDVENFQGTELPSTGGMGTTIFYVVGGIMVLGAAVLMVTKRRVNSAK